MVVPFCSVSSQDCQYRQNAKDEFTGDALKMTKWQTVINHAGLMKNLAFHLSLVDINDQQFVEMKYELRQDKSESIGLRKGISKLMLKMATDEVISLDYAGDQTYTFAKREYKRSKSGKVRYEYDLTCKFALNEAQKLELAKNKIVKLRLVLEKDKVELDIQEKLKAPLLGFYNRGVKPKKFAPQEYFMHAAACL